MEYNQIGFSNIRMPDDRNSNMYTYSIYNTFPQEVFLHEFLHTLERNEKNNGNHFTFICICLSQSVGHTLHQNISLSLFTPNKYL